MYNNKLAVALKSSGKVLREFGDTVYIPFGSEYSIYIKNMNTVRALVTVEIDGDDVGDGQQFVVNPNDSIDIERFLRNGNLSEGNRFKFIERTGNIEDHRGIGVEDGLVRVEFAFEKKTQPYKSYNPYNGGSSWTTYGGAVRGVNASYTVSTNDGGFMPDSSSVFTSTVAQQNVSGEGAVMDWMEVEPENDVGITVEGSISDQKFKTVAWFPTEATTHAIVLKMLGETTDNVQVRKPVTVKTKATCTTCGRRNKATAKFCTECGTSLQIV